MITAYFRSMSVTVLVLSLSGCQSPGSFASLFGKKDDPAIAAAPGTPGERDPASPFAGLSKGAFGNRGVEDELRLAKKAQEEGRLVPARMSYEKVLQLQPRNVEAHQGLAIVCDQLGSYRESETHFRQALDLAPRDAGLHSNLGYSYYMQGRTTDAARELQIALELEPTHRTALYNLGLVRGKQGNLDQALALFRESVSEDQAQSALAQFRSVGEPGGQPEMPPQFAGGNRNDPGSEPEPPNMTPEMRKVWETIQKERIALKHQQVALQNKRAQDSRISAPYPGRNVAGRPAVNSRPTAEEQRQQALKYLQSDRPNPAEYNKLFDRIDHESEVARAQSGPSRSGPPSAGNSYQPQNPGQGNYAAQGASHTGAPASYQQNQAWMNAQEQPGAGFEGNPADPNGLWNQPANPQMASSSGLPDWKPLTSRNAGQVPAQSVSASRQLSGPMNGPRITSTRNSNSQIQGSMDAPPAGPPVNSGVPLWNSTADQPSTMQNWSENSLPVSQPTNSPGPASSGDEFTPIPGQGGQTAAWGNGTNQTSAQPANYSGVIQASAVQFAPPGPNRTQAPAANSFEQARLAAAQMGLHAGSGSPFPPGESENSANHANVMGGQPGSNQPEYSGAQSAPPQGMLSPHHPIQGASIPAAIIPSAQGLVYGAGVQSGLSPNQFTPPQIPRAMIPTAQGFSYGQTGADVGQDQMLQSVATETLRQRLQYDQKLQNLDQSQKSQLQQWQANSRSTSPGNAYPSYRPGPRALPTDADLPPDGGFPGR